MTFALTLRQSNAGIVTVNKMAIDKIVPAGQLSFVLRDSHHESSAAISYSSRVSLAVHFISVN